MGQIVDNAGNVLFTDAHPGKVEFGETPTIKLAGAMLEEQLTQADASDGVLTFSESMEYIRIYNTDGSNDGVFTVNGVAITVPKGEAFESGVGGTPSAEVSVTGATTYIVGRYS